MLNQSCFSQRGEYDGYESGWSTGLVTLSSSVTFSSKQLLQFLLQLIRPLLVAVPWLNQFLELSVISVILLEDAVSAEHIVRLPHEIESASCSSIYNLDRAMYSDKLTGR